MTFYGMEFLLNLGGEGTKQQTRSHGNSESMLRILSNANYTAKACINITQGELEKPCGRSHPPSLLATLSDKNDANTK